MLAFTFILGQKQAQLQSAMETVKICSKCVGSTINAGSGFHCSSVLRLFDIRFQLIFEFGKSTRVIGFIVAVITFTIAVTKFTIAVTIFTITVTTRSYTTFLKTVVYVTSSSFTNEVIITI